MMPRKINGNQNGKKQASVRKKNKTQPKFSSWFYELGVTMLAGLLGMPGGVLLFLPLYHPLHDIYKIHSEVTFFILFSIFLAMAWSGDRKASPDAKPKSINSIFSLIFN
jgi:hypothetical protein